jgi:hypothetical protein
MLHEVSWKLSFLRTPLDFVYWSVKRLPDAAAAQARHYADDILIYAEACLISGSPLIAPFGNLSQGPLAADRRTHEYALFPQVSRQSRDARQSGLPLSYG